MLIYLTAPTTDFHTLRNCDEFLSNNTYNIIIIGSGPTALGAAQRIKELKKLFPNITVAILEQREKPGGLASSERDDQGFL